MTRRMMMPRKAASHDQAPRHIAPRVASGALGCRIVRRLQAVDPASAGVVDVRNPRRTLIDEARARAPQGLLPAA